MKRMATAITEQLYNCTSNVPLPTNKYCDNIIRLNIVIVILTDY